MRYLKTSLAVIGAAVILALAANTVAMAATGQNFILGKTNYADFPTTIERTNAGSPFKITADSTSTSSPPFTTNATGKVVNLNVDKVDGLDGGTQAYTWKFSGDLTGSKYFSLTGLPVGTYLISYSVTFGSLSSADGLTTRCYIAQTFGGNQFGGGATAEETATSFPSVSGSAVMTQPAFGNMAVRCTVPVGATWTASAQEPVRMSAVPIAGVTDKGSPVVITPRRK